MLVARIGALHSGAHFHTKAAEAPDCIVNELCEGTVFDDEREADAFFGPDRSRWQVLHLHEPVTSTSPNLPPIEANDVRVRGSMRHIHTATTQRANTSEAKSPQRVLIPGAKGFMGLHLMTALEATSIDEDTGLPQYSVLATVSVCTRCFS